MLEKKKLQAGKLVKSEMLIDVPKLIAAYYDKQPDMSQSEQRVIFGTSGHRGCATASSFNELHVLAMTQAICLYRREQNIKGPLFLGVDTHALSMPAFISTLEVLAANKVDTMIAANDEYTPTPVISHAILTYNRDRQKLPARSMRLLSSGLADGIVITPSHNPPHFGGFKYNPPHGGPADRNVTNWIENMSNEILKKGFRQIKRMPAEKALQSSCIHYYDYMNNYINDLHHIIDMDSIKKANISIGIDPLGGAGVHYWDAIAARYSLNITVLNRTVDPTFRFMMVDSDGEVRMDPSSPHVMTKMIETKDRFDVSFACDTDHDRHGIVTRSVGLLPPNHYLSAAIFYLSQHRPAWKANAAIGKTIVSSQMIDRIAKKVNRNLYEVPVGFKWFVQGLLEGSLAFCGEESAGAAFLRQDGRVWTTDKDGLTLGLLSAEMTARMGRDPGEIYHELEQEFGVAHFERISGNVSARQKTILENLTPKDVTLNQLAGEDIQTILTHAPANKASIGGLKVITQNGWFMIRPSGTENIYRIYAESIISNEHLRLILTEAQNFVNNVLTPTLKKNP